MDRQDKIRTIAELIEAGQRNGRGKYLTHEDRAKLAVSILDFIDSIPSSTAKAKWGVFDSHNVMVRDSMGSKKAAIDWWREEVCIAGKHRVMLIEEGVYFVAGQTEAGRPMTGFIRRADKTAE